jgi:excisionase family DNA binding protein
MVYNGYMAKRETIYGVDELAKFLRVTKATVRDWCSHGRIPAFKIGKEWKIRVADLQKSINGKVTANQAKRERENSTPRLI